MRGKKETSQTPDFIKWFSELNKDSGNVAGGKGANLSEIYNLKIPVPPGFVVTAQAYDYFIEKAGLDEKIKKLSESINYEDTKQLDEITKQIRALIINSKFPKEMEDEIIESYESLDVKEINISGSAHDILKNSMEPIFVAVRSSATTEDLAEASFAGQQDSFVNVKGNSQLLEHIRKCFASLFTSRATYYRNKKGFKHEQASLAVVVQKMVDSDKSGVIFSKDPSHKNDNVVVEAVFGLGEGIVSGRITPDNYVVSRELEILNKKIANKKIAITRDSGGNKEIVKLREEKSNSPVLKDSEVKKLSEYAIKLEDHFQKPQDIEFAIENGELYIVQTRPITTIEKRFESSEEIKGEVILTGIPASPGIASGKIKIIGDLQDLHKINKGDILVTKMTNPDMVVTMQRCSAIVTDEGGMTAHAAIVSREMGIPAVVGTQEATMKLKEGEIITVDGYNGKIYKGKTSETIQKEVLPVTAKTKTQIKVIVDLPSFAKRAASTQIKKVGLTRIEGIIAESGKHPNYFINKFKDYEEIIFKGIKDISNYFEEIWVRTSDIRSDEFANLEGAPKNKEANPMLGMHGIRYGLKNPEILKSELRALKRVADEGKIVGILLPQVILVEEVKKVKEFLIELDFTNSKLGVMVETPAVVQLIRNLCEEGIDFVSFGTNDLTQYMLAVDRGNEQVQDLYDEMHPAILYQLEYVIRVCKRNNVETSICGQAGSNKKMVEFLVEKGIDSISVNADMASEIANYIAEIEMKLVKNTDREPRQYQPEEKSVSYSKNYGGFVKPKSAERSEFTSRAAFTREDSERIERDIQEIEKEKQEYFEKHPEEKGIIKNFVEKTDELIWDKRAEVPLIPGVEKLQEDNEEELNDIDVEKDIEEIEKEKKEYLKKHPEEKDAFDSEEDLDEKPEFKRKNEILDIF
ncbi:MAG: phosphoenolpyruvate synthase [archaeon]